MSAPTAATQRIEGLDGLRAISILLVLAGHGARVAGHPAWLSGARTVGVVGVELFFAISGFIITWLMIREHQRSGSVNLRHFWGRRALRILPPLAAMLAGFGLASAAGVFTWSWRSFVGAASFSRNLAIPGFGWGEDWFLAHTWSLSMEEQFYAVWPLIFAGFFPRRGLVPGLLAILAASPLMALICEFHLGAVRNLLPFVPYLASGCLLAVWLAQGEQGPLRHLRALPGRGIWIAVLSVAAFCTAWLRNEHHTPLLWVPLDAILMPAAVFLLLSQTVNRGSAFTRLLSTPPLRALGMISYSLYLWQQLFFAPADAYKHPWLWGMWPWNFAAALVCGTASYWLMERGSARFKARFS